jgi:hypothetical protein
MHDDNDNCKCQCGNEQPPLLMKAIAMVFLPLFAKSIIIAFIT